MKKLIAVMMIMLLLLAIPQALMEEKTEYSPEELQQHWEWLAPQMFAKGIFPFPIVYLQRGDQGMEVVMLQARLRQLLYYTKAIDGDYGSGTQAAMKSFEEAHALTVDGIADLNDQLVLFGPKAMVNAKPPTPGKRTTPSPGKAATPKPGDAATSKPGDAATTKPGGKIVHNPTPVPINPPINIDPITIPSLPTVVPILAPTPKPEGPITHYTPGPILDLPVYTMSPFKP